MSASSSNPGYCATGTPAAVSKGVASSPQHIRVLHINSGNLYGGVETILVTLARLRHLCPGMEPSFAVCHEGRLSRELIAAGVPVFILGSVRISRWWTVWRGHRRLREILKRECFDIVICHMPWSLAVFGKAVRAAGHKLGFWAHAFHTGRNWLELLARRVTPDLAIGNSRFTEAGLSNLFPKVPRGVIYPPVALTRSAEASQWRSTIRAQQQVSEDTVVIIQVSRLEPCKGHLSHLKALAQLEPMRTSWQCWIVGGPQRQEEQEYLLDLQGAAAELGIAGRLRFLGQRTDVPQLLAAADIFCQPNQTPDSFGISFVEALWAGLPVVTTAMGGAKEIIDNSCGFLLETGNPALLAARIHSLIESPELRASLGRAGAARAFQLCDPASRMKSLSDLARDVIGAKTSELCSR
jgi:glycosyltransferase involved in cell wall biosynthesis